MKKRSAERMVEMFEVAMGGRDFVEIPGNENCSDCEGWNGVYRRCQCGNRRCYWEIYEAEKEEDCYLYPEVD